MSKKNTAETNGHTDEPLSHFQDLKKTGRTDVVQTESVDPALQPPQIRKVKLVGDDYLEIEFSRKEFDGSKPTEKYENKDRPAHPDFRSSLNVLRPHLAILTTFIEAGKKKSSEDIDDDVLEPFTVTGVSMAKNEDDPGVVITGYKTRPDGKTVTLNTPFQRFEAEEGQGYKFMQHLELAVDNVLKETRLYIGGKRDKKVVQAKMDMPEPEAAE